MHVRPFLQKQQHSNAVRSSRTSSTKLLSMLSPLTCTGACGASCSKPTAPFPSIIFRVRSFHVVSGFDCAGCNALLCRGSYNRLRGVFRLEAQDRAVLGREGSVVEEVRSRRGVAKRSVIGCTFILSFFFAQLAHIHFPHQHGRRREWPCRFTKLAQIQALSQPCSDSQQAGRQPVGTSLTSTTYEDDGLHDKSTSNSPQHGHLQLHGVRGHLRNFKRFLDRAATRSRLGVGGLDAPSPECCVGCVAARPTAGDVVQRRGHEGCDDAVPRNAWSES